MKDLDSVGQDGFGDGIGSEEGKIVWGWN